MNKLCIIGLGLLGGSIGKDCIANHHVKHVIGFGRNKKTLEIINLETSIQITVRS